MALHPGIPIWLSESEESDDEGIDSASQSNFINCKWKNKKSQGNLRDKKKTVREELRLYGSDYESSDEEAYDEGDVTSTWTSNFETFTAEPDPFTGTNGPTTDSADPLDLFTKVWDKNIMNIIALETNRYARELSELQKNEDMPEKTYIVEWEDTTAEELYVMLALKIFSAIGGTVSPFRRIAIPKFREVMSLNRFKMLSHYMHFVDNTTLPETDKLTTKIKPIMDHCNTKFSSLYKPSQYLDVSDSLLLSKAAGPKSIRMQANYFGVRTYELSEVSTGYLLKVLQFPGSDEELTYKDKAQIVLDLVNEYSNKGYRVITDSYFTSVHLARMLKSKGFDYNGETQKNKKDLPLHINQIEEDENDPHVHRLNGERIEGLSSHCGDVSVVYWNAYNQTNLSTFQGLETVTNKRGTKQPAAVIEYTNAKVKLLNRYDDLALLAMRESQSQRWYITQFMRLLNFSLSNIYIIHKCNSNANCLKEVKFRHRLADMLLDTYAPRDKVAKARVLDLQEDED